MVDKLYDKMYCINYSKLTSVTVPTITIRQRVMKYRGRKMQMSLLKKKHLFQQ